jgi:hypothetical protein
LVAKSRLPLDLAAVRRKVRTAVAGDYWKRKSRSCLEISAGSARRAAIGEKDWPAKRALADRRMAAIDPLGEGLCAPVSLHFNGLSRAESPVNV